MRASAQPGLPLPSPSGELRALTGLRFVAAFAVFVFHVHVRWPLTDIPVLHNLLSQGAVGMTVFFMLSGFVLAHRYADGPLDVGRYLRQRVVRIYPVYALAALLALPVLLAQLAATEAPFGAVSTVAQGAVLVVAGGLLVQAWFPMLFPFWNNGASWSISAEAFFYACFIPLIGPVARLSPRGAWGLGAVLVGVSVLPAVAFAAFPDRDPDGLRVFYAMPVFRLAEFVLGMVTFVLWNTAGRRVSRAVAGLAAGAVGVTAVLLAAIGPAVPFYTGHNGWVVPTVALVLVVLASGEGAAARVLGGASFVALGRISYGFYSFQFHVLAALGALALPLPSPVLLLVALGLLLAVAAASYRWVEEPARRALTGGAPWRVGHGRVAAGVVLALAGRRGPP